MTTAIVHGDPGCFKTASLVSEYGIPALFEGRTVVTNIRGFNSIEKIEQLYKKNVPESAQLISIPFNTAGYEKMATFFHWAPSGALILFDEIQRVYPTRLRSFKDFDCDPPRETGFKDENTGEPEVIQTVEEAFDCHRHMNWDIYMSTTNIEKVHKEIRQVAEFGYRQKGIKTVSKIMSLLFGDFKRVKHNAENKGNTDSGALSSTFHRIDKRAFKCYQSTATGVAMETHTKNSIFSQPKLLLFGAIGAFAIVYLFNVYFTYGTVLPLTSSPDEKLARNQTVEVSTEARQAPLATSQTDSKVFSSEVDSFSASSVPNGLSSKDALLGILKTLKSWSGSVNSDLWIEQQVGDSNYTIKSNDLERLGFTVEQYSTFLVVSLAGNTKLLYPTKYDFKEPDDKPLIF